MKVLFSNPPWWVRQDGAPPNPCWIAGVRAGSRWPFTFRVGSAPDRFRFGDYLPYPFFMGYATTYAAEKTGLDVRFRDSIALRESYERYYQFLEYERFDYVFIESSSPSWEHDEGVLREIHGRCPGTRLVITGPITVTRAAEILEKHPVHACIRGEYEKGSVRVLNGETGVIDFDLLSEEEMNAAPFPYYDGLHAKRYWDACPPGQLRPHAQIWSSRGCPFKCIFCVWPATMTGNDPDGTGDRTVRFYSPEYLEAFVRKLLERHHYRWIYFDDDTFNLGSKHVLEVCEVMRKIGVPWSAMCRADTISMDTWAVMKESGCFGVKIGVESGNQWVLDNIINKRLDLERTKEVIRELKRLGMYVHGTFTLGLPGETPEQMADTLRFIKSLPFDTFQVSGAATLEGTPLHSLQTQRNLERYPGAVADEGFLNEADGAVKLENILRPFTG